MRTGSKGDKKREARHADGDRCVLVIPRRPARFGTIDKVHPQTHGGEPWYLCDVTFDEGEPLTIRGLADYELRTPAEHAAKAPS